MIGGEQFRFEPETHSYFLGKTRLIGVSEAIQSAGLKDFSRIAPDVLEHARQRGTAVHAACHFLDEGDLDWATVSQRSSHMSGRGSGLRKRRGWNCLKSKSPYSMQRLGSPEHRTAL
jgi:hypothetical protein